MFETMTPEHSAAFDAIVRARRTVRAFATKAPSRDDVEAVIQAGLLAPFAALAVIGRKDWRKVVVMQANTPAMASAAEILKKSVAKLAEELEQKVGQSPFVQRMKHIGSTGIPALATAPYFIVVAERKGIPPVADRSLCHCLQNMWLKATALGLGVQLVSATSQLEDHAEFCTLLGLPTGEYALDACALGYPAEGYGPTPVEYPTMAGAVSWI